MDRPCSDLFDSDTMLRLGSSGCSVTEDSRSTLHIELSGKATIMPGGSLSLKGDNTLLAHQVPNGQDDTNFDSTGSIQVAGAEDPVKPVARITDSAERVNELCPSQRGEGYEPVIISGVRSSDPSGRAFSTDRFWLSCW
ncbi:hypothetical protein DUNSADRAFT_15311 [Dunaliella salina]|uniref:Encoded protein n=1 Tax=Dunaliella salina TaxID=3046 RepID=A0ABQ7G5T0_DUNSA|nr:hypothetical protein DUNSADRAFT_15311 [Dunaliella salina]KAF5829932.1 hypothetical protein DUNSADRAFT_15311 [Dunaliella salina]|eukprot:KAF5829931.1 hypothetical protein DUNSADRAFT_15311 [Dunaliella salina]